MFTRFPVICAFRILPNSKRSVRGGVYFFTINVGGHEKIVRDDSGDGVAIVVDDDDDDELSGGIVVLAAKR